MKIAILGNSGSWYVDQLLQAAQSRGHAASQVEFTRLTSHLGAAGLEVTTELDSLLAADAVIVRTMPPGSLEQVVYRMDVLLQLQQAGKIVLNHPRAIECAVDKFLTTSRLAAAGLPVPRTIVCESAEDGLAALVRLGGDVVVKPIFGAEGRGIMRISDPDLALRAFRVLERLQQVLYLQEFIEHPGYDLRVLVLNGEVLGGMRRSNADDFRTNVARNGIATLHQPTAEEANWALQAARTVHACFAGVDLMYDLAGRCYIVEVNAVPGWRAFERVTSLPVAERVICYLESC